MPPQKPPEGSREILFEMFAMGNIMKVIAIDSLTGTEVSIQGPVTAGDAALKKTAMRKLQYVLEKKGKK